MVFLCSALSIHTLCYITLLTMTPSETQILFDNVALSTILDSNIRHPEDYIDSVLRQTPAYFGRYG